MSSNLVTLVNTAVVPAGLICIMFGMGLSLQARVGQANWRQPTR
jgi:predicted Na+-dependent transporter